MGRGASGRRPWEGLVLAAILALALGLRLHRIAGQSLWNDEGTSVALALRSLGAITRDASHDIHPPLYYYLLHGWVRVFGSGEFAVRGLSALLGVGVVGATYALARRLFPAAVAALAALFVAAAPFHVYYSQEARMYILVTLCAALATLALVGWRRAWVEHLDGGGGGRVPLGPAALYVALAVAAVYSHYLAFSVLLAHNLAVLAWLGGRWARREGTATGLGRAALAWVALQAAVVALYVPWLAASWSSLRSWPAVSEPLSALGLLRRAVVVYGLGVTVPDGTASRAVGALLALLAGVGAVWGLRGERAYKARLRDGGDSGERAYKARLRDGGARLQGAATGRRQGGDERGAGRSDGWGTALVALYALVPVVLVFLLSLQRPMYKPKFLLLATPGYHVLQAVGIWALARGAGRLLRRGWAAATMGALLSLAVLVGFAWSLRGLYADPRYARDDYRGIVAYIEATCGERDAILINAPGQVETVDYYYDGPLPLYPLPLQRPIDVAVTERALEDLARQHERVYAILWATDESDPGRFVEGWLDTHTYKTLDGWFGNVRLAVYAVPERPATEIGHPLDLSLGDVARLKGYTLGSAEAAGGEILQLTLFWEALGPTPQPFKVFTHLVDARGNIVAQRDSEPSGGSRPTTAWSAGEPVADNYGLLVQPGTPPGPATLRVGMYGAHDGVRLPVASGEGPLGDAVDLAKVEIRRAEAPPPLAALDLRHPHDVAWGGVRLLGHRLERPGHEHEADAILAPGEPARLVLYWRRESGEVAREWVASLRDRAGRTVWRQALRPVGGELAPEDWREGDILRDIHVLFPDAALATGDYGLFLGPAGEGAEARRIGRLALRR